jgi:hypothetical protein
MSRIARKGFTAALLVCLLAAPIAAAAPAERAGEREAPAAPGWFEGLVEWVGGWLIERGERPTDRSPTRSKGDIDRVSAENGCDGGGSLDPNSSC